MDYWQAISNAIYVYRNGALPEGEGVHVVRTVDGWHYTSRESQTEQALRPGDRVAVRVGRT